MKKRDFLKLTGAVGAGIMVSPFIACGGNDSRASESNDEEQPPAEASPVMEFTLPALGYSFDALQPGIDAMTMEIHHDRHHAGYVKKLNAALSESNGFGGKSLEEILGSVQPGQSGVRNNGGGHYNHSLYWDILTPGGPDAPEGQLADAINSAFGDFVSFSETFFSASKSRFGSGWGWLCVDDQNKLFVSSTPNQDNPLMSNIVEEKGTPILGVDVWEHAYYLNYQNKRGDYINAFIDLINWEKVAARFASTM